MSPRTRFSILAVLAVLAVSLMMPAVPADAAWGSKWKRYSSSRSVSSRFGGARPATGYGANLHRNFVLRQEAQRAARGKQVRRRNNVFWWYR